MAGNKDLPDTLVFTGIIDAKGNPIYKARGDDPTQGQGTVRQPQQGRYTIQGNDPGSATDFFGPGQPLFPMGPEGGQGRQMDFPVGFNIRTTPRQSEGITYQELRLLADNHDVTRLLVETRKDQMCKLDWNIRVQEDSLKDYGARAKKDAEKRADATEKFLTYPDGVTPFADWLRMLLEDLLVIDAPSIYVNTSRSNDTRFEVMDGATIKRLLDPRGRTPDPPNPAYQQIIKGLPAWDYTSDELIYKPRNPRPGFIYGMSPVQQIVLTVNIALRKQLSQLQYYTDGNIPDALIGTPPEWTPAQILEYQQAWDALHEGNTAMRRRAKFVPGNATIQQTREVILKDDFDEWLARVACYAFSISPQAFVKEVNRATAETAKEAALEEGLAPLMQWVKGVLDRIVQHHLKQHDLEFVWGDADDADPDKKDQILDRKVKSGRMTINEARLEDGMDPIPGGDVAMIFTASGAMPVAVLAAQTEIPSAAPPGFGEEEEEEDGTSEGTPPGERPSKPSGNGKEKPEEDKPTGGKPKEEKPEAEEENPSAKKGVGGHRHEPFRKPWKRY